VEGTDQKGSGRPKDEQPNRSSGNIKERVWQEEKPPRGITPGGGDRPGEEELIGRGSKTSNGQPHLTAGGGRGRLGIGTKTGDNLQYCGRGIEKEFREARY